MPDWNTAIIEEFRANGGKVKGWEGAPLLILHTTGARTGKEHVNPVTYREVGDSIAIFASKAGAPDNPDWFHNLVANPSVRAEIGSGIVAFTARVASPEEREPIWTAQKASNPGFAEYESKTSRQIPVVILEPAR
jgi:deazaflavin-dependent oxidoreductase (nitroreductase family)